MYNICETLNNSAQKFPEKIAFIDEFGSYTYSNLFERTEALKLKLQEKGVKQGTAVGIITANNHEFVVCLYAAVACGALVMPIFHLQKDYEINRSIIDAGLHFVLCTEQKWAEIISPEIDKIETDKTYFFTKTKRPVSLATADFIENPAFMRYTSGTTGTAKGVIISHENVLERIEAANESLKMSENNVILWVFPMAYHFVVSIVLYLKEGATIVVNNSFLADEILESITKYQVSFFYCSPMHIKLLAVHSKDFDVSSLEQVISTTTGASQADCLAFENKFGLPVKQAFGIIEVGLPIINTLQASKQPDAVGHALPAFEVEILDDDFQAQTQNSIGLLGVKGKGMFSGYLNPPQPVEDVLKNGWFLTGDLAIKDSSGLITIKGRKKNVIIVHGNKVFPGEVEEVINRFPGVVMSKVSGKTHTLFGEIVIAEVVKQKPIEKAALIAHCKKSLSAYKIPQSIIWVDEIEMTASGKIKRA